MKALNLYGINDLRYEEVVLPHRLTDEVTIKIKAAGICGSDIPRIFTKGTYHYPTIPGHEFAGEIVDADDSQLIGKHTTVFPLIPCGKCGACAIGEYQMCSHYDYYGSRRNGGFAEFLNVKKNNLIILPDAMPMEVAAMCEPVTVALHAIRRGKITGLETVAVWGLGPIGFILAKWLQLFGVQNIILLARDDLKVMIAQKRGFIHAVNVNKIDIIKYVDELTKGAGIDVCIEGTGNSDALSQCLHTCKRLGTVVAMGNPNGEMLLSQDAYWEILRKQLTLIGTWNSSFNVFRNDWRDAVAAISEHRLNIQELITHKFALSEYKKAFNIIREKKEYYCKVVFIND